jgi:hypothetical protein
VLVSTTIAGTAVPAAAAEADPIYAAIEEHKRAHAAVNVEIVKTDELEAAIPSAKRKTLHIDEEVFETDDPRWLTHLRTLHELYDAESDAECALADIVPTTAAGVCALLKYGVEHEEVHGTTWNNLVDPDDESGFYRRVGRSWQPWHRRHAIQLGAQLPEGKEDALLVLEATKRLVTLPGFWDGQEQAKKPTATIVRIGGGEGA